MNVFVVGEVIRESVSQTRAAAVRAGTDSQPRLEEQNRASQMTARLFRNGQAHHAMRVEFPARFLNPLARTTAREQVRVMCSTRTVHPPCTLAATNHPLFYLHNLRNNSFWAMHYSLVFGDCQVHEWRCYTHSYYLYALLPNIRLADSVGDFTMNRHE